MIILEDLAVVAVVLAGAAVFFGVMSWIGRNEDGTDA